jgi:hypothetical protein
LTVNGSPNRIMLGLNIVALSVGPDATRRPIATRLIKSEQSA